MISLAFHISLFREKPHINRRKWAKKGYPHRLPYRNRRRTEIRTEKHHLRACLTMSNYVMFRGHSSNHFNSDFIEPFRGLQTVVKLHWLLKLYSRCTIVGPTTPSKPKKECKWYENTVKIAKFHIETRNRTSSRVTRQYGRTPSFLRRAAQFWVWFENKLLGNKLRTWKNVFEIIESIFQWVDDTWGVT